MTNIIDIRKNQPAALYHGGSIADPAQCQYLTPNQVFTRPGSIWEAAIHQEPQQSLRKATWRQINAFTGEILESESYSPAPQIIPPAVIYQGKLYLILYPHSGAEHARGSWMWEVRRKANWAEKADKVNMWQDISLTSPNKHLRRFAVGEAVRAQIIADHYLPLTDQEKAHISLLMAS
jgi:hypothetical protein